MPQYSQAEIDTLLEKIAAERATLLATADSLTPTDADSVPQNAEGEEQWTAKEQLAHLWEMERSYIAWARAAIANDGATVDGLRGEPVAIPIEDAASHSVAQLTDALRAERARTNHFIRSLPLPHFQRRARTQVFGELTVMQWLRSFYRHDRQHAAQIAGRRSAYVPNFRGGREPNQRQMRIDATRRRKP